ncbi:PerC family transcriptional regulator [Erwinia pyrifoliae]|uniref:PerC family transcriptional regulator n=1 Tax=Erwinia pyrifoliae TaxID=79967 RepID=A0ABY5X3K7_ERWPY|nr:PerC family transcriptional regulator [Erwinia pyrifoliae]MCT2385128.1 PerC family transcriptional regulator [Erwinia pyrifoliae]MCT2388771.1 PerC family transcriptional regulator [Erwinia pyrifoliae]MCU8585648.1 PerC family transcriptional regulator [Erwinia pyrifoliae]UWS31965.1 PerC family transcriptional regulator [Erwinia pyrifoliae]UXK13824.1 PerC family transcriptional regulator [Erwinia pyrifoliae]
MNIRENAVEYIRLNPGCTSTQIANGAGIPKRMVQPLMTELYTQEVVLRYALKSHPFFYRLPDESDKRRLNDAYEAHREKAEELEKKHLWNRAAREWLLAMDETRDEEAREKAIRRREYCISHGKKGGVAETSAINVFCTRYRAVGELNAW